MSLRSVRAAAGKGLNQVARESGIYAGQLSAWENGKMTPGTRSLQKLAAFYQVTIDELLRQDDAPAAQQAAS